MNEEVKKEVKVESAPSSGEFGHYHELVAGGSSNLVMVACKFEGQNRFAVAKKRIINGRPVLEPLAIVLNENDPVWFRTEAGDLLPVEGLNSKTLLN